MSRFTDNGNDTILDNQTGLTWFKKDSRQMVGKWLHLEKAMKFAEEQNAASFGGFSDWRIPKLEDVKTIFDKSFSQRDFGNTKYIFQLSLSQKEPIVPGQTLSTETGP